LKKTLDALITYRLEQAEESLRDAEILLKAGGSFRSVINRAYYTMFYSLLALFASKGMGTSKHAGVISIFDREYVKIGTFPKEMSRVLHKAFYLRQDSDYKEFSLLTRDETKEILSGAEAFCQAIARHLDIKK
jgi:uncharacterized protein (UPF0332 family)